MGLYLVDRKRVKNDHHVEKHLERVMPKTVFWEDAGGIYWKQEDQCEMAEKKNDEDKKDGKRRTTRMTRMMLR